MLGQVNVQVTRTSFASGPAAQGPWADTLKACLERLSSRGQKEDEAQAQLRRRGLMRSPARRTEEIRLPRGGKAPPSRYRELELPTAMPRRNA